MIAVLGELGLYAGRICQIPLSPATLAAILAETGDLRRYESSSSVKHAGMSPARNESGGFRGQASLPPRPPRAAAEPLARDLGGAAALRRARRQARRADQPRR